MKYFATAKHHSQITRWEELKATSILAAKREASKMFKGDLHGSVINLVECHSENDRERLNDLPAWTKIVAAYPTRWHTIL